MAQRIARMLPTLIRSHRQVAGYVLAHPLQAAILPIDELAATAGVSVATANRFDRALEFDGHAQFRAALVLGFETTLAPLEKLFSALAQPATVADVFACSLDESQRNIELTRQAVDAQGCSGAVKAILGARRICIAGFGTSSWLDGLLQRCLDPCCSQVQLLASMEGSAYGARILTRLGAADLLVAIAFPRYFGDTVILAQRVRAAGVPVVALTDRVTSLLAPLGNVTLYAHTDIEGVAGVFHHEQVRPGNPEYERARLLMTHEANAAIAGAFDAGATEVLVNDSHGGFRNLPPDVLDARVQAVMGKPRYLGMMAGVDAVCLVGYHSRAQCRGILAHTINSLAFAGVYFNETELGEAGIYGALAGEFGVPVVMASGDNVFIGEHCPLFPHATFVQTKQTKQTKQATGQTSGISQSPAMACRDIRAGVAAGLAALGQARPYRLPGPLAVRIQTAAPAMADLFCQWPALQRMGCVQVAFEAPTVQSAVRMVNCLSAMAAMLR